MKRLGVFALGMILSACTFTSTLAVKQYRSEVIPLLQTVTQSLTNIINDFQPSAAQPNNVDLEKQLTDFAQTLAENKQKIGQIVISEETQKLSLLVQTYLADLDSVEKYLRAWLPLLGTPQRSDSVVEKTNELNRLLQKANQVRQEIEDESFRLHP